LTIYKHGAHNRTMSKEYWEAYYTATKNQDWEQAIEALESLCALERRDPQVLLKLGDTYQRIGDSLNAIAAYHKSAWILKNSGFAQKALALYKIILRLDPYNEEALKISRKLLIELETYKIQKPASASVPESHEASDPGSEIFFELGRMFDRTAIENQFWAAAGDETGEDKETIYIPSLFESVPPDEMIQLIGRSAPRHYSRNEAVIKEGDSGNSIYLIQSGNARVITYILGQGIELAVLSPGDVFGEVAFLTGRPRTASIVAVEELKIYEFEKLLIEEIFDRYPEAMNKLHDFYQCRVQDTIEKIKVEIKKIGR
jgi:tetratricopeptide (TPR) repeat protein